MARQSGIAKTCHRCGRSGSHAFRRTTDGLYECTTSTACRARERRNVGAGHDGRGRLPAHHGLSGTGLGVAYVIGPGGEDRDTVGDGLRDLTDLAVVCADADRAALTALGSRNVRLIAVAATCLDGVGFRNEFGLRRKQPRLSTVPVLVYGHPQEVGAATAITPGAGQLGYDRPGELEQQLRRQVASLRPSDP